jgi:hypothetical protein
MRTQRYVRNDEAETISRRFETYLSLIQSGGAMLNSEDQPAVDLSVLEVLAMYDKAWLPPALVDVCEPMWKLGLIERDGPQWRITDAGRTLIGLGASTIH